MKHYVVDFETYYFKKERVSAGAQGLYNYVRDSYAYLVSVVGPDEKWVGTIEEARQKFPDGWWSDPSHQFWAANSNFDQAWADHLFVPSVRPWKCILDRGAYSQLPQSLAGIAKVLKGKKVDKSIRDWMNGKHYRDLSPEKQKEVIDYCLGDSVEEYDLLRQLPRPSAYEEALAEHTRRINRRGVNVDVDLLEENKTRLKDRQHEALRGIPWGAGEAPLSAAQLAKWCAKNNLPVPPSLDKRDEIAEEVLSDNPKVKAVVDNMRVFRKTAKVIAKIESILRRVNDDGVMPLEMMYCGARHTRRWSSRGVNVQNLERVPIFLSPEAETLWKRTGELTDYVWERHWIIPPPGKVFLTIDYSQIEPRVLHWFTGNTALLEAVKKGFSVYEAYARINKGWKGNPGQLKSDIGVLRYTLIKNEVLGLGYGMGASKYTNYAGVPADVAEQVVSSFRKSNPRVVRLWRDGDKLIRDASQSDDRTMVVELPNGEFLQHFYVSRVVDKRSYTGYRYESYTTKGDFSRFSKQDRLWGGVLTENIVQRIARDFLGEAVLRLEKAGFMVMWTAHDEVILAIDRQGAEETAREAEQLMLMPPAWAPDIPLAAEWEITERYTK